MQEQGSGGVGSSMLRTRPNTIIRGDVQGEYVVRGAKIKCSKALKKEAYDVVNLPLCHGVYSGKEPLINIKDMKDGENIVNGFGICSETGTTCVDEMKFHINWINRKKIRLHIEGEQAVTTNSFTMCSAHGGEITFENSGQTAVFAPKNEKSKDELLTPEETSPYLEKNSRVDVISLDKNQQDISFGIMGTTYTSYDGGEKKYKNATKIDFTSDEYRNKINEMLVMDVFSNNSSNDAINTIMKDIDDDSVSFNALKYKDDDGDYLEFLSLVNNVIQGSRMTEEINYFRNKLNKAPKTMEQLLIEKEKWRLLPPEQSIYHMFGKDGEFNLKFVSSNGGNFEAVYDKNGKLVTDPKNMGTYNYLGPNNVKGHGIYDVIPYYSFNTTSELHGDPITLNMGAKENKDRFYNNPDAIKRYEEIEQLFNVE